MLSLLASILSWDDDQRQQVGLQQAILDPRKSRVGSASSDVHRVGPASAVDGDDTLGDGDNFTDQWVSFLLREANSAESTPNHKSFASPVRPSHPTMAGQSPHSPGSSSLSTLSAITRPASELS